MTSFEELPFEAQLAWLEQRVEAAGDATELVRRAAALPDVEPLCRLLDRLAIAGASRESLVGWYRPVLASLSDPGLSYLLGAALHHEEARAARRELAVAALSAWPLSRATALALAYRWLAGEDKAAAAALRSTAAEHVAMSSTAVDPRWLFFLRGAELARLADEPAWSNIVRATIRAVLTQLAHAPKSLSQANAEGLLSRQVYADPGHFLFELMQNADDAGATEWRVGIGERHTVVTHDGAPFSFLDVVGICSIGLTTKREDAIGLFGVGFKSVFEVTERPRIHSGAFHFEIAHVSMPRPIAAHPRDDRTVLVLPHRDGVDASVLTERARAIPPETLLTLPHLRRLSIEGVDGSTAVVEQERHGSRVALKSDDATRDYACAEETVTLGSMQSPVLVAAAVGSDGALEPRPEPGLFAFLPTAERTGLPVLVHARFEVTVDRERLERGSERNLTLLENAGRLYAALIERVAAEGRSVLGALPIASELTGLSRPLAEVFRTALADVACLPAADGLVAPRMARLVDARLIEALRGVDLGGGERALTRLDERAQEKARFVGARTFGDDDLWRFCEARLEEGAAAPPWLGSALQEVLAESAIADEALRRLPLLETTGGGLAAARDVRVATAAWAALYAGLRPLVAERLLEALDGRLLQRLAVAPFRSEELVTDIARYPVLLERESALFAALAEAPSALLDQLGEVPLFRGMDGERHARADGICRLAPQLEGLRNALSTTVLLAAPPEDHADLLERMLPCFDLAQLIDALSGAPTLADDALRAVAQVLDAAAPTLSSAMARRAGTLPIFEDVHGVMRPLLGPDRALIAEHAELVPLLPELPWLASTTPFVRVCEPPRFGVRALLSLLAAGELATQRWVAIIEWLGAQAGAMTASDVEAAASLAIWPDALGAPRRLAELRLATSEDAIERFYAATGQRRVAHEAAVTTCRKLRIDRALAASHHETAIADLLAFESPASLGMAVLGPLLREASRTVAPEQLADLLDLPIFADETGTPRAAASWSAPDVQRVHRPGPFRPLLRGSAWPLSAEAVDEEVAPFFEAAGVAPANAGVVARLAAELTVSPSELLRVLLEHAGELDAASRKAIQPLALFASRAGRRVRASELAFADRALAFCGAEQIAALGLDAYLMTDGARAAALHLGLPPRPLSDVVVSCVLDRLTENAPLTEQPPGARSRAELLQILALAIELDVNVEAYPLALDFDERLVRGRLFDAPEGVRALAQQLPLPKGLSDAEWAQDERAAPLLDRIEARHIAMALRAVGVDEHPRSQHPVLRDPEAVFVWLREHGRDLASDAVARSALGAARVISSQRGTLRAPNELVLSGTAPDLGLAWGLAEDVPADVAAWLSDNYELDRQQRRSLVDHVLDGVDAAVAADDRARVVELVRFLAASLGAGAVASDVLDRRVRRLKVRARLRVPSSEGGFDKPRFAWAPSASTAALSESFMVSPPRRVGSELTDDSSRTLLAACGAAADLAEDEVEKLLSGDGLRDSATARVALARYVAQRALESPRLYTQWKLSKRAWVPDRRGRVRRPGELLWPEPAVRALFGEDAGAVVDDSVVSDLPSEARARLGFLSVETLSPSEIAQRLGDPARVARPALLTLLESGLSASRFTRQALAQALRDRLVVRDDEGTVRPITEVCVRGSRELFGSARGDVSFLRQTPLLARALSIPEVPDLAMMLAFLGEQGEMSVSLDEERDLARHLPEIYRRLAARARKGTLFSLPARAAVVAMVAGESRVTSLDNPALRLAEPPTIADALEPAQLDRLWLVADVEEPLHLQLLAAGVPDLLSGASIVAVERGVRVPALADAAEQLHAHLARGLGARAGRRIEVRERLSTTFRLALPSGDVQVTAEVDAVLERGTLLVTEAAIAEPSLIAIALENEPRARVALWEWLSTDLRDNVSRRSEPQEVARSGGWLSQILRFFGATEAEPAKPRIAPPAAKSRAKKRRTPEATDPRRDAAMFRPQHEIASQLEGGEGWIEARSKRPAFGFRFAPESLPSPWLYAPKVVATQFDRRSQSWQPLPLERPASRGSAGAVRLRGTLPAGESVLPIPLYGRLTAFTPAEASRFPSTVGGSTVRLAESGAVTMDIVLGIAPDASAAVAADVVEATRSFVPDDELPEEVLAFVEDLDEASPLETAHTIRDFVRRRYRYDPTYLEDAAVGRWLARVARGRAHVHVAALHAAADGEYLGAGVCHELNTLTCELLRRAAIPAGIATGWVFTGGGLSEPDHLWVTVFLAGPRGEPLWVPIDASTTENGRPLRVARRPPVRGAPATEQRAAPKPPPWAASNVKKRKAKAASKAASPKGSAPRPKKQRPPPQAELFRLLRYLERRTGRALTDDEKREIAATLHDPRGREELLTRLRGKL